MAAKRSSASVVVLAFGAEDQLEACIDAVLLNLQAADELVVVDNGFAGGSERLAVYGSRLKMINDGANTGFAGGCNLGAASATGEVLVFVNSDAVMDPGALEPLVSAATEPTIGIACGSLRLAADRQLVNSAGNPMHYTGVTWAGHCGELASRFTERRSVTVATGGFFAVSRSVWTSLGGFHEDYFAYHEDADLSLRTHLMGKDVVYIPEAVAVHDYEFARNPRKLYLIERNRLLLVFTDYPTRVRHAVLPAIILTEPLFLILSVMQGWSRQKVEAWIWLARNRKKILQLRRIANRIQVISDQQFAALLVNRIEPPMVDPPPGMGILNAIFRIYWAIARRALKLR